jgi:Domain of Unknown Function with PDB structure (DUF3857)
VAQLISKGRTLLFYSFWLILAFSLPTYAQQPTAALQEVVREFKPATEAFTRSGPYPIWALPALDIPSLATHGPIQVLYSESQYLASSTPAQLQLRAFRVNDQSTLKDVGQFAIEFAPAYEKLHLHSVRIIRRGVVTNKTPSVNLRFLQRETGFEEHVAAGFELSKLR